jgi:two-component system alkaline phosphatase synthesis response regulator PhoP
MVARDGQEALDAIARELPDLLLLDVMMPKKTGFEVCHEVRANEAWHGLKILMLTAKGRDTDVAKGTAMGADAYMTKPFATRDLVQKVARDAGGVHGMKVDRRLIQAIVVIGVATVVWLALDHRVDHLNARAGTT